MEAEYFYGIFHATEQHHDVCYERFIEKHPELPCYRFGIREDLRAVEITNRRDANNGIWSLAEVLAGGENIETIDRIAKLMQQAIDKEKLAADQRRVYETPID